jgi:methylmalonyl-CoA mutase cobalamin-binding subunit
LSSPQRFEVAVDQVAAQVMDGEVVVINLSTGSYYTSNAVAGALWPLIEAGHDTAAMAERLCSVFEVEQARAEADLETLLQQLEAEGIIRVVTIGPTDPPADAPSAEAAPSDGRLAYEAPAFEVFRDMEQLLALDPPMPDVGDIPWHQSDETAHAP